MSDEHPELDQLLLKMSVAMETDNFLRSEEFAKEAIDYLVMKKPETSKSIGSDWSKKELLEMLYEVRDTSCRMNEMLSRMETEEEPTDLTEEDEPTGVILYADLEAFNPECSEEEKKNLIDEIVNFGA